MTTTSQHKRDSVSMFARASVLSIALFCLLLLSQTVGAMNYKLEKNLAYSQDPLEKQSDYQKERCKLDVYYPENANGFATVVWFHGGGLTGGGKHFPSFKNSHLGMVAVNYRLYPKARCEEVLSDAAAAVAWTFKNIAKYGGDPKLIFVSGHSAGGYITSMLGYDKRWLAKYGVDANELKGLIPYSGHTITHMTVRRQNYNNLSARIPVIDDMAPIYHARPDAPPTLLLVGDRRLEMLGRTEENELFYRALKNVGFNKVEILEFQGYGHGMAHPAGPVALKWIEKILGCTPMALIVPLDHQWNFTKRDRKYSWRLSGSDGKDKRPPLEWLAKGGREDGACLAVRDESTTGMPYASSSVLPVLPGKVYVISGWIKNEAEGEGLGGVCVNYYQGSRQQKQIIHERLAIGPEWTRFEIETPAIPEGISGLNLYLLGRAPGQPLEVTGTALFDELKICEKKK